MALLDKLAMIKLRFDDVAQQIIEPEVIADMKRYVQLNKEYKDLTPIIESYLSYKTICDNIEESNEILATEDDAEMKEMARMELDDAIPKKAQLEEVIKVLLIPKDPEYSKNAVVEIRAGQVEMKRVFLRVIYLECILDIVSQKNGEQNS